MHGESFSNKTPNMLFFAAPVYSVFYHTAKIFSANTSSDLYKFVAIHFITFFCSGIWGALSSIILFFLLEKLFSSLRETDKLLLSFLIPLSTQLFPYSTVAFVHAFEYFWYLFSTFLFLMFLENSDKRNILFYFGLSFGVTILANPIFILLSPVIYYYVWRRSSGRYTNIVVFTFALLIPFIPFFIYNYINFHSPFLTNRNFSDPVYTNPKKFLGVFWIPRPGRILKILFWSHRSFFPSQFHLLFFIPGLYLILKKKLIRNEILIFHGVSVFILFLFITSFNGWHGGLSFGPRYMTLLIPIFVIWSIPVFKLYRKTYIVSLLISCFLMLAITSIDMFWCFSEAYRFPVFQCILPNFIKGRFALNPDPSFLSLKATAFSYNLGHIFRLTGLWSLFPLILFLSIATYLLHRWCNK